MNPSNLLIDLAAFPGGVTGLLVAAAFLTALAVAAFIAFKIFAKTVRMAVKTIFIVGVLLALLAGAATLYFLSGADEPATRPANSKKAR